MNLLHAWCFNILLILIFLNEIIYTKIKKKMRKSSPQTEETNVNKF